MLWLVLDTSAPTAVVAVVDIVDVSAPDRVLGEVVLTETRRHAEALPSAVDDALAAAGIDAGALAGVAAGVGPGSFIGVRTGLAFAKGFGRALDRPVVGLPSLLALAAAEAALPRGHGLVVVDAKRGERYAQRVVVDDQGGIAADGAPLAFADASVDALAADAAFVVGAFGGVINERRGLVLRAREGPSGRGLLRALRATDRRDERATLVPFYARPPDAKLPAADPARHRPMDDTPEGPA